MITQTSPTRLDLVLTDSEIKIVKAFLTYTDKTAEQLLQRFKKNRWMLSKMGEHAYYEEVDRLKSNIKKCLLFADKKGLWTYSGLAKQLEKLLNIKVTNKVEYPEVGMLPWANKPKHEMYYYQKEALEKLLVAKHAGVEIGTGLGKTFCLLHIVKHYGLQTVVMAPSSSIVEQIYDTLEYHFGSKRVGKCYGGKKDYKKLITVALPQTLTKLEPKSDCYKKLSKSELFVSDESHLNAANTLSDICFGLFKNTPYRFFFSATQMRNDGKDLLLDAINGPIVYNMTVKEGVNQSFLARPIFKMLSLTSDTSCSSDDPNELTRHFLYYNPKVNKNIGFLANNFYKHLNHQILILIDEVEQFTKILPYLEYEVGFAHGPLSENKSKVPEKYWESNPNELVRRFNDGELPILIGTSCISTGTDIKAVKTLIYAMGGKSEVQVKQALGRGTRLVPGKTEFNFIDFDIINCPVTHRHALARRDIYNDVYGPVEEL